MVLRNNNLIPTASSVVAAVLLLQMVACAPQAGRTYGGGSSSSSSGSASTGPTTEEGAFAQRILELTNNHRRAAGLLELSWSEPCAELAYAHSKDMAERGFFDHVNPDGQSPFDRMDAAGIPFTAAGENIAEGYTTPEDTVAAWMRSDGHRANILSPDFTELGVGMRQGESPGPWWTQVFRHP